MGLQHDPLPSGSGNTPGTPYRVFQLTDFTNGTKYTVNADSYAVVRVFIDAALSAGSIGLGPFTIGTNTLAMNYFELILKAGDSISCAGIVGSGDPFITILEYYI